MVRFKVRPTRGFPVLDLEEFIAEGIDEQDENPDRPMQGIGKTRKTVQKLVKTASRLADSLRELVNFRKKEKPNHEPRKRNSIVPMDREASTTDKDGNSVAQKVRCLARRVRGGCLKRRGACRTGAAARKKLLPLARFLISII